MSLVGNVLRAGRMLFTLASVSCRGCSTARALALFGDKLERLPVDRDDSEGARAVPAISVMGGALNWRTVAIVTAKTGTRKKYEVNWAAGIRASTLQKRT